MESIYDKAEQYFKQQSELFGEQIYIDPEYFDLNMKNSSKSNVEKAGNPVTTKKTIIISNEPSDLFTEEPEWKKARTIDELYEKIKKCQSCELGKTRTNFVFGTGNPHADIMVIGEAPGADEDMQGKPFVGRAGQLLTKILESIGLKRDDVFIGNIIKCRPPNNRRPEQAEVDSCEPFLMKQIELIQPAFILALGLTAVDTLLKNRHKMGEIRGSVLNYHGIKMLVTYHPAALLRNPGWKKDVWEDVKLLRKLYDEYLSSL